MDEVRYNELFSNEDKIRSFDKIAGLFYNGNFGATSKSEIELLMFSEYMDMMIKKYEKEDKTLDYNECSDFKISRDLGITNERVRTLKLKKQARYPHKFDWEKSLVSIRDNIRYDEGKKKVIIPVNDPNLYNAIREFIEEKGGYIEVQRNSTCIQIKPEYLFMLLFEASNEDDKEKIEKELRRHNGDDHIESYESRYERINHILGIVENSLGILGNVSELSSNPLASVVKYVFSKLDVLKKE